MLRLAMTCVGLRKRLAPAPGARPAYSLPWASLLSQVFALDVLTCPRCGSPRRLIAVLTDPRVVRAILVQEYGTA
jgi:hypothetical protein